MFIEHASRMLGESAVDFYRDIKEEKVVNGLQRLPQGRWLQFGIKGSMRASSQFKDTNKEDQKDQCSRHPKGWMSWQD